MSKKKKLKPISKLVEEATTNLQLLVRLKASDENGYVQCVTCGVVRHYKNRMQGGHFIERRKSPTKLVEENVHPQCAGCNLYKMKTASGVLSYRDHMVGMYGEGGVNDLIALSNQKNFKWNRAEVEGKNKDYTEQIKYHQKRLRG